MLCLIQCHLAVLWLLMHDCPLASYVSCIPVLQDCTCSLKHLQLIDHHATSNATCISHPSSSLRPDFLAVGLRGHTLCVHVLSSQSLMQTLISTVGLKIDQFTSIHRYNIVWMLIVMNLASIITQKQQRSF